MALPGGRGDCRNVDLQQLGAALDDAGAVADRLAVPVVPRSAARRAADATGGYCTGGRKDYRNMRIPRRDTAGQLDQNIHSRK